MGFGKLHLASSAPKPVLWWLLGSGDAAPWEQRTERLGYGPEGNAAACAGTAQPRLGRGAEREDRCLPITSGLTTCLSSDYKKREFRVSLRKCRHLRALPGSRGQPRHLQRPGALHWHLWDRSRRTKLQKILCRIILNIFNCKCKPVWSCCRCCGVGWAGARACGSGRPRKLQCWAWLGLKLAPPWAGPPSTRPGLSKPLPAWPGARPGIFVDKPLCWSWVNALQLSRLCAGRAVFQVLRSMCSSLESGCELLPPVPAAEGLWAVPIPGCLAGVTHPGKLQQPQVPPQLLCGWWKTRASLDRKKGILEIPLP